MRRPPWSNPPLYNHLLAHQRPEQSRFTPKKSTVDRILSLRVLIERRREFHQPFLERTGDFVRRSIKCIVGHSGISFTSERFPKRSLRWSVHFTPTQKVLSDTVGHIRILFRIYGDTTRMCHRSVLVQRLYRLDNGVHGQLKFSRGIVRR